ncbi:MAG: hypothetical protein Q7K44_03500 [Candidatus Liptonbacteria bacterium]|nr:hypothetical protein [Candidatus Liptonbacteria bacterium]
MKHAAMTAKRRVSTARIPERAPSNKEKKINITGLLEGTMLEVRTRFSVYLLVVVNPAKQEIAMSNNSTSVPNGPFLCRLEGAGIPGALGSLMLEEPNCVAVGLSIGMEPKRPMFPRKNFTTSIVKGIRLLRQPAKAQRIVSQARAVYEKALAQAQ